MNDDIYRRMIIVFTILMKVIRIVFLVSMRAVLKRVALSVLGLFEPTYHICFSINGAISTTVSAAMPHGNCLLRPTISEEF